MPYREIAAVIRSRGFVHAREPKNPEKQLADSVWTAMYEDDRFDKVGRGIFDPCRAAIGRRQPRER